MASKPENRFKKAAKVYTEEEFNTALASSGLKNIFGEADLALAKINPTAGMQLLQAKQDYNSAPEGAAGDMLRGLSRARAEDIRKNVGGYTTSADGMAVTSGSKPTYSGVLARGGGVSSVKKTSSNGGDAFAAYKTAIEQQRAKTIEDVAGQVSALTGGFGSSSAATKAAAAGADYNVLLAEKQAEFEKQKYDRALSEANIAASFGDYSKLKALGIDTSAYEAQQKADRDAASYATALSQAYNAASIGDYSQLEALGIDTSELKADAEAAKTAAELSAAYKRAEIGDFSALKALGIDTSSLEASRAAQTQPSGGTVKVQEGKPVLSLKEAEEAYKSGNTSSNVIATLKYYYGEDYFETKAGARAQWSDAEWESAARSREVYMLEQILRTEGNAAAYAKLKEWYTQNDDVTPEMANLYAAIVGIEEPEV